MEIDPYYCSTVLSIFTLARQRLEKASIEISPLGGSKYKIESS